MRWFVTAQGAQVLAVHAALVRTGKIVYFSGDEHDQGQHDRNQIDHTRLFDCTTLQVQTVGSPTSDVFCSGHAMLRDGRVLVAGGTEAFPNEVGGIHHPHFPGLRDTWVFDPATSGWSRVAPMNFEPGRTAGGGRWYPTLVTLPGGQVMAMSGHPASDDTRHDNNRAEFYTSTPPPSGSWVLFGPGAVSSETNYYPRLHVVPSGDVFCSTPFGNGRNFRFNIASTSWIDTAAAPADPLFNGFNATSVLLPLLPGDGYRPRVLLVGSSQPVTIDLGSSAPAWRPTLARTLSGTPERHNLNAVLLPTGEVFVCGGVATGSADSSAVLAAEVYQPGTDSWVTLPAATVVRNYHSVAMLMPDGRVWTAGSNKDAQQSFPAPGVDNRELRIEIFEPWYFTASRPQIAASAGTVFYGQTFQVQTAQASSISRVAVIRTGSVTHAFNPDQRYVGLQFSHAGPGQLTVIAPPDAAVAPPGYYLLFVIDQDGVPSVGQFIVFVSKPKDKDKDKDKDAKDRKDAKDGAKDKETLKEKDAVKEKDQDLAGQPPLPQLGAGLGELIGQLTARVGELERRLATGKAFISPEERPELGEELFAPAEEPETPPEEELTAGETEPRSRAPEEAPGPQERPDHG